MYKIEDKSVVSTELVGGTPNENVSPVSTVNENSSTNAPSPTNGQVVKLTKTQQRVYDKLTSEWQTAKQIGEYEDVLNRLVILKGVDKRIEEGFKEYQYKKNQ